MIMKSMNYNKEIEKVLNYISDVFHKLPVDITENNGNLSISIDNVGEYFFNKQSVSEQLWASSPITGPSRFNIKDNTWMHYKTSVPLKKYLDNEIEEVRRVLDSKKKI